MPNVTRALWDRGSNALTVKTAGHLRAALGDYIRERRGASGLTQRDLANAAGYTHVSAISNIEAGRASIPPERYLAFAAALGVRPAAFFKKILQYTNPWGFAMLYSDDPSAVFEALDSTLGNRAKT